MKLKQLDELMGQLVDSVPVGKLDEAEVLVDFNGETTVECGNVSYDADKNQITFFASK